jgi:integrase
MAEFLALQSEDNVKELSFDRIAKQYLEQYRRRNKPSSVRTAEQALDGLTKKFGKQRPSSITGPVAGKWALENAWRMGQVIACGNWAVKNKLTSVNPFKGLKPSSDGRRDHDPLTEAQVAQLAEYAERVHPPLKQLVIFAAYTGLRVGECLALRWDQVDMEGNRIDLRRLKSGRRDPAALTPPAKAALMALPRYGGSIFRAKKGGPLSYRNLAVSLWPRVQALFGEFNGANVDFHELRHFAGHHMYVRLGLLARVVATQLGHKNPGLVESLYGHFRVGALDEIDAAFAEQPPNLRAIGGGAA